MASKFGNISATIKQHFPRSWAKACQRPGCCLKFRRVKRAGARDSSAHARGLSEGNCWPRESENSQATIGIKEFQRQTLHRNAVSFFFFNRPLVFAHIQIDKCTVPCLEMPLRSAWWTPRPWRRRATPGRRQSRPWTTTPYCATKKCPTITSDH